jgi:hypothetical protein
MAHVVLANGQTAGEALLPQIDRSIESGKMPKPLPGIGQTTN